MSKAMSLAFAALALAACGQPAPAQPGPADANQAVQTVGIEIVDPRINATPGPTAAGYAIIRNAGAAPDRLLAASSPRSPMELHDHVEENGVIGMRRVEAFEIPPGGELVLARGAKHLMLMSVGEGLQPAESVPVTLTFENAGEVEAVFPVVTPELSPHGGAGHGGH